MSQSRSRFLKGVQLAALAALGATAFAVTPAQATVISSWGYTISSQFDTTVGTGHTTYTHGGCYSSNTTHTHKLAWGCEDNNKDKRSSLVLHPYSTSTPGTIDTNGGTVTTPVVLTHNNFVITGSHLKTTNLMNTITLNPSWGGAQELDFGINFTETDNSGTCTVQDGGPKCSDIFVITDTLASALQYTDSEGNVYTLDFGLIGVDGTIAGTLSDAECAAAGAASGCFGFTTMENQSNSLALTLAISGPHGGGGPGEPVPEPNALGMMGFGLFSILGLLFLRRRRTAEGKAD